MPLSETTKARLAAAAILSITVVIHVAYKCSTNGGGAYSYSPAAALTMAEAFKLTAAVALLWMYGGGFAEIKHHVTLGFALKNGLLATLYFVGNHIAFRLFLTLDMSTITAFKSLVPVMTAVAYSQVFAPLRSIQWTAIILQVIGVFLLHYEACKGTVDIDQFDLGLLLSATAITSIAGVRNEVLLKRAGVPLHSQNTVLYSWGVLLNGVLFMTTSTVGFFDGFSACAIAVVIANSVIGLCITAIYKYADVNVKNYVISVATIPILLLSPLVTPGKVIALLSVLGALVIVISTILYFHFAPQLQLLEYIPIGAQEISEAPRPFPKIARQAITAVMAVALAAAILILLSRASDPQPVLVPVPATTSSMVPVETAVVRLDAHETYTTNPLTIAIPPTTPAATTPPSELHCVAAEATPLCLTLAEEQTLRAGYGDLPVGAPVDPDTPPGDDVAVCLTGGVRTFFTHNIAENIGASLRALGTAHVTVLVNVFPGDTPDWVSADDAIQDSLTRVVEALRAVTPEFTIIASTPEATVIPVATYATCDEAQLRIGVPPVIPQYDRIYSCARDVQQIEIQRKKRFDWFYRLRPDVRMHNPPTVSALAKGHFNGHRMDTHIFHDQYFILPAELAQPVMSLAATLMRGCYSEEFVSRLGTTQLAFRNENRVWPEVALYTALALEHIPFKSLDNVSFEPVRA
jgi:hypothetical protein